MLVINFNWDKGYVNKKYIYILKGLVNGVFGFVELIEMY